MTTTIEDRDLTKQAPHSPRERIDGFAVAARAIDKCRANTAGKIGEYHYDCPLDNMLFNFKGITGEAFTAVVATSKNYEDVGTWLQSNGTAKTTSEIKAWSDGIEASSPLKNPERRETFIENCWKLGINPETTTTFDWLEADDRASFPSPGNPPAITSAQGQNTTQQLDKLKAETKQAKQDMADYVFAQKSDFVQKMQCQLTEIDQDLNRLNTEVAASSEAAQAEAKPKLEALRHQATQLNQQFGDATHATESTWNAFKACWHLTCTETNDSFQQARQWLSDKIAPSVAEK